MSNVAQEIRDLANRLAKINEGDYDDLKLGNYGSELDLDDEGDGEGFTQKSMFEQLGKVIDSAGNPNPVSTVTTDDGKTFPVTVDQAKTLRMFATTDKVKPMVRSQFIKDIQKSETLHQFLDIKDYHEMGNLFITKYLG